MFKGYLPETRHKLVPSQWEYQRSTRLLSKQRRKSIGIYRHLLFYELCIVRKTLQFARMHAERDLYII